MMDDDTALMLSLQNGEDTALNGLMTRWQTPLVGFIYRYVGSRTDALDLAQETFVRVFESRHRYKAKGKFSTWLFTIASNLCRNYLRWQKRHPTIALESPAKEDANLLDSLQSECDSPTEEIQRRELVAGVRKNINSLPHDLKTAVILSEYQDLSHQEIAAILGCTAKAVETRLYRARNILRERLAPWTTHEANSRS